MVQDRQVHKLGEDGKKNQRDQDDEIPENPVRERNFQKVFLDRSVGQNVFQIKLGIHPVRNRMRLLSASV